MSMHRFVLEIFCASAIGHAVVFHRGTDDRTGTNGNAGSRPGCGIIDVVAQ
jgi:Cu/Zn superoxide dismutase